MLNVIDEFTRECLAIRIDRKLKSTDVIDVLSDLFILRGVPGHVRSDNGPEFIAKAVQEWIAAVGGKDRVHRARQSLGERILRKLQLQAPRRAAERRDLLQPRRGQSADRSMAAALQHCPSAQQPRLSSTGTRNGFTAISGLRFRFAPPPPGYGGGEHNPLTINTAHSVGAGHVSVNAIEKSRLSEQET